MHLGSSSVSKRLVLVNMDTIETPRRVKTVRIYTGESPILISYYKQNIVGNLYLVVNKFDGGNYIHIRKYFTVSNGILRTMKDGCTFSLDLFTIFIDSMEKAEPRFWAMENGLSVRPYEIFIGPWKFNVDIFGNICVFKYYYDPATDQLMHTKKGISFPLDSYRPLARAIFNLLDHFPNLKDLRLCYDTIHSQQDTCSICSPFAKFRLISDDTVRPIANLTKSNTV